MVKIGTTGIARRIGAIGLAIGLALLAPEAPAASLLRDAETEYALDTLSLPVMVSANLLAGRIPVLIVNDMSLNAFVTDGRAVFMHAGLFLRLKSPEQVQAVIAHELGHITNSHTVRRNLNADNARLSSGLGVALGLAAGVLSGRPDAGFGVLAGTAGSARGVLLAHTREEEAAADRSGMRYLARSGIDPKAMAEVMRIFVGQEDLLPGRQDAYLRSHPLSRDRLRAIESYAEVLGPQTTSHDQAQYWFDRAQAKLGGYLREPDDTFRRYPERDGSDAGRIGRAMAYWKLGRAEAAYAELDPVIAARPGDVYLHELKGWIALESNRLPQALASYARAAELSPKEPQILAGYGRALLAQNTRATDADALKVLETARARDRYDPALLRDLAMAYARTGGAAEASLYTAERYALLGDDKSALVHARRAAAGLSAGSPGWNRAQDIITAAEREAKTRR